MVLSFDKGICTGVGTEPMRRSGTAPITPRMQQQREYGLDDRVDHGRVRALCLNFLEALLSIEAMSVEWRRRTWDMGRKFV